MAVSLPFLLLPTSCLIKLFVALGIGLQLRGFELLHHRP